ncbi:hypothetical protein [Candidatus Protochlamydia amoebophila]|uniref:Uncharacterized protein n=1 Tax=Protochlamydia amoebophila (strain UWE25) TaxID=264201 RepID=Q6MDU3_PARUW|nr:hypothetical protein [Candidatus Protochlamydia amoebophila]CAF23256.1 unnamed protein product [Candidatus Protochlamydia amoebophila UWE25]
MKIEKVLSYAEEYLSMGSGPAIIGIIPGIVKVGMGGTQCLSGLACTIIFSTATIFDSNYTPLRNRSASHIIHGAANIIAGIIEAIPFVGFVGFVVRMVKSKVGGKKVDGMKAIYNMRRAAATANPTYQAIWNQRFKNDPNNYALESPKNYVLVSPNNFKFIGYKTLQNDSDTYYQEEGAYYRSLNFPKEVIDPNTIVHVSNKEQFKKTHANARFFDAPWGPVLMV